MSEQENKSDELSMLLAWDKFTVDNLIPSAHFDSCYDVFAGGWQARAEQNKVIIDRQAEELAALRGFANEMINGSYGLIATAKKYQLLDIKENATKLLTGCGE